MYIYYETKGLTIETAGIWTLSINTSVETRVILHEDVELMSLNVAPPRIEEADDAPALIMPAGSLELTYTAYLPRIEEVVSAPPHQLAHLSFNLFANGMIQLRCVFKTDVTKALIELPLITKTFKNLVITNQYDEPPNYSYVSGKLSIATLGAYMVNTVYETNELTSMKAGVWSFKVKAPIESAVTLPRGAVILSIYPLHCRFVKLSDQLTLIMPAGGISISYTVVVEAPAIIILTTRF